MDNAQNSTISGNNNQNVTLPYVEVNDSLTGNLDISRTSQHTVQPGAITSRLMGPNPGKPVAILSGAKYSYRVKGSDLDSGALAGNFGISFVHGLTITPNVQGLLFLKNNAANNPRPLPFVWSGNIGDPYFGQPPAVAITIDSVDKIYINIRITAYNIQGYSLLLGSTNLLFKFYCFNYDS